MTWKFKTKPFEHQLKEWLKSRDLKYYGILWEQGTGKTKLAIDTAAWLRAEGKIDAMLVVAPNGVHSNWVTDEIPVHWPSLGTEPMCLIYHSKKAQTKRQQRACKYLMGAPFPVLVMSYDGIVTDRGGKFARKFLDKRKVFYVLDESARIKSPDAKRTRRIIASGKHAEYKRILTGTAITNSAFDVYTQFRFLDENFWKRDRGSRGKGFASFGPFKTYFGIWKQRINHNLLGKKKTLKNGKEVTLDGRFEERVGYRNLEELGELVRSSSSRVTKDEVLDLPPKVYTKRYFEMSAEQSRTYQALKKECIYFLESGGMVSTPLVITRLLRFQQILCGYLPDDDGQVVHEFDENPLLDVFLDTVEDVYDQAIVWARFRRDVDLVCRRLDARAKRLGLSRDVSVRYDGAVGTEARQEALARFRTGDARFFVGNPAVGGEGLTLIEAHDVLYYSNDFKLGLRLQSEDRAHRIGQTRSVRYTDFSCLGTVLEHIVKTLREKRNIASIINGDRLREWI